MYRCFRTRDIDLDTDPSETTTSDNKSESMEEDKYNLVSDGKNKNNLKNPMKNARTNTIPFNIKNTIDLEDKMTTIPLNQNIKKEYPIILPHINGVNLNPNTNIIHNPSNQNIPMAIKREYPTIPNIINVPNSNIIYITDEEDDYFSDNNEHTEDIDIKSIDKIMQNDPEFEFIDNSNNLYKDLLENIKTQLKIQFISPTFNIAPVRYTPSLLKNS